LIKENGRIIAVDANHIWVETINRGTCGTCVAEKGCGQTLLARWLSRNHYLKVSLDGRNVSDFSVNDTVQIGIPENVVVVSALLVYCLPLFGMLFGASVGQTLFNHDLAAISFGVIGLLVGAVIVRLFSYRQRNNLKLRPVILDLIHT